VSKDRTVFCPNSRGVLVNPYPGCLISVNRAVRFQQVFWRWKHGSTKKSTWHGCNTKK